MGAFVVGALVLLTVLLFAIGDWSTIIQPSYLVRVLFSSANGITEGSPVQYAGVEVGKVQRVRVTYPSNDGGPRVEVHIRLPSTITVRSNDSVAISTFGLLGEKYLEITPGDGTGEMLGPGSELAGKPPVSTERIIERSDEVLTELKRTLEGVNGLVGDQETHIYLQETLKEARDATRQWRILGERLNGAVSFAESGQGNLGKLLYDDELYQRMNLFVEDLRANPWKLLIKPKQRQKQ